MPFYTILKFKNMSLKKFHSIFTTININRPMPAIFGSDSRVKTLGQNT